MTMPSLIRKVSITNALALGLFAALLSLAALCAAVMPSPAEAQNAISDLGACMSESDCLQGGDTLPEASNCTEKFCFNGNVPRCGGNTGICYVQSPKQTLSVPIGNATVTDLAGYIQAVYDFAVAAAAVLAATMMMIGGFQYLTAGGDAGRVTAAKDRITGALIGLVLVSAAYLILNTINPSLTNLELPRIPVLKRQIFVGCETVSHCKPCGEEFDVKMKVDAKGGSTAPKQGDCSAVVEKGQGDVTCVGMGCNLKATKNKCDGSAHRCVNAAGGQRDECGLVAPGVTAAWVCAGCKPQGAACGDSGASDECCGGFCGKGKCSSGEIGESCSDHQDCRSGICQTNWGNSCSPGGIGLPCDANNECRDGVCSTVGSNSCSTGKMYNWCGSDKECPGLECADNFFSQVFSGRASVCKFPGEDLKSCNASSECGPGMFCNTKFGNFCTDGSPGVPCAGDDECTPPSWKTSGICVEAIATCTDGSDGSACRKNEDCQTDICFIGAEGHGACVTGALGTPCKGKCQEGLSCRNGVCNP